MGPVLEKDLERGDSENRTTRTDSTYHSDIEKVELNTDHGAMGEPDPDHEEVEQMDAGHLDDIARQHVSLLTVHQLSIDAVLTYP